MNWLKERAIIFIILIVVIGVFAYLVLNKNESEKPSCLMNELTRDDLYDLALKEGLDISGMSEESIQEILNRPLCKDICLEQLEYSKQYPEEWFADDDLRAICDKVDLPLPI